VLPVDDGLVVIQQGAGRPAEDMAQLQQVFQKRLDSFAEDMSRPIHAARADMEFVQSVLMTHEIVQLLTTPLMNRFLLLARRQLDRQRLPGHRP
jgi:hypothetical protein